MKILVYGATGSQMRPLVAKLIEGGHVPFVLTRNPAASSLPSGAQAVKGDLEDASSVKAASRGMDVVVFMLPAFLTNPQNALRYAGDAADAAAAAGVKLIVWNTSGRFPMPEEHRESDEYMRAVHEKLSATGVPLIVIAPTKYMENLLGPWASGAIREGRVAYPVFPQRKMGWIAARDVCSLVALAVERPELAGRIYRVSGQEAVNGNELAAIFSEVLGRPFTYRTLTPDEMKASLEAAFGPGAGDEVAGEYALDQADPNPRSTVHDMSGVLRDLPAKMTSVREWIGEHRRDFLGS